MTIHYAILIVILGCGLLAWSADRFIVGAAATARHFHLSPLFIGMALVGFATSLPEMIVSATAAFNGNPVMGVGNAIGSNITNIGLVLGITAIVTPLTVRSKLLKREFPMLLGIMLLSLLLIVNGYLSKLDGLVLISGFVLLVIWLGFQARSARFRADPIASEYAAEMPREMPIWLSSVWMLIGLVLLLLSSKLLVFGAVFIAKHYGVSDLVIGLTIVAVGTSLPELAASVVSAIRGEHDIAIGNVLGSNMFNLLGVLAMPGLIMPTKIPSVALWRDYPIMFAFTLAFFIMAYGFRGKAGQINRIEGGCLLLGFIVYILLLFHAL